MDNFRVPFNVSQVVGGNASTNLPAFSSRLYYEIKSIRELLGNLHVARYLEIGCGYARLTPWISGYSDKQYGIEPEKKLYEISKKLYPYITFVNMPADNIPFQDNYFNIIISWTVLQHIPPEKINASIKEILRVANDKAIILIAEHTKNTQSTNTWGRSIKEYSKLFSPFELVKHKAREVEILIDYDVGEIMMFKRRNKK